MNLDRRRLLTIGAAATVAAFFGSSRVFATLEDIDAAIASFAGDAEVSDGGVLGLKTPEIAQNRNSVPVSITVESPMTEESYVSSVLLLAEGNPHPEVATFRFTPMSGNASVSTRMRITETQNVVALAKLNTGKFYKVSNLVKVTSGSCSG